MKKELKKDYNRIFNDSKLNHIVHLILTNDLVWIRWKYVKYMRMSDNYYPMSKNNIFNMIRHMYYERKKNRYGLLLGFEINSTNIGEGLLLFHNGPIVINKNSIIGKNCSFHGDNCVGNDGKTEGCPIIGNNVDVGVGAKIIGNIRIADNVRIGAGAVVISDIEKDGAVVVGVPGRIIKNEKNNNKIVFICPYFGKLHYEQTLLFLRTCSFNHNYDWIIFTDDKTSFELPDNVIIINMSFLELKSLITSKIDFEIRLDNPYKLCDYKPIYGYIFEDYISNYKYWGHCDFSDALFGDINSFFPFDLINKYDKINFLGHFTLYRNSKEVNSRFLIQTKSKTTIYDILNTEKNMAFDELNEYSINEIYFENNFSLLRKDECYSDISPYFYPFIEAKSDKNYNYYFDRRRIIILWDNGKLYRVYLENKNIIKEEICYVHYKRRNIQYDIDFSKLNKIKSFWIVPNKIIDAKKVNMSIKEIKKYTKNKFYLSKYQLKLKNLKNRLKRIK